MQRRFHVTNSPGKKKEPKETSGSLVETSQKSFRILCGNRNKESTTCRLLKQKPTVIIPDFYFLFFSSLFPFSKGKFVFQFFRTSYTLSPIHYPRILSFVPVRKFRSHFDKFLRILYFGTTTHPADLLFLAWLFFPLAQLLAIHCQYKP